jgi:uncharacterized membrane protein
VKASLRQRLLPGSSGVWIAGLIVAAFAAAGIGKFMMKESLPLTGTNSVDIGAVIGQSPAGKVTCVRNLVVPSGTGRIGLWIGPQSPTTRRPHIEGKLTAANGRQWRVNAALEVDGYGHFRDMPLVPPSTGGSSSPATFCFRVIGAAGDLGGSSVNGYPKAKPSTIAGNALTATDIAVRFLTARHTGSHLVSRVDDALRRAALFKGFPGGSAILWIVLLGFIAGVPYFVLRTAATVSRCSVRTLASRATIVAAFAGIAWALMLPPLHGADEAEHLAYAQHVAETGHRADAAPSSRPPYSSDEQILMGAIRHSSTVLNDSSRVRWDELPEARYESISDGHIPRDDGGGFTDSASGHSPLYYAIVAIPYKAFAGALDLAQLDIVMRITTALIASLVAGLAVWCASFLAPRRKELWWLAGMLVALQPVFNSISGTVNNDTLVNVLAAVVITLLIHAWRNGPQTRAMAGLGVATVLLPIAKITGFALWPVVGLGLLVVVATHRRRADLMRLLVVPLAAAVTLLLWVFLIAPLVGGGQGALLNVHPSSPTAAANVSTSPGGITRLEQLNYLVQMVLPFVHLTGDVWAQRWPLYTIYVERGYGRFGWLDAGLAYNVLRALTVALIIGWSVALVAAARHRREWRRWVPGTAILIIAVVSVVTFVGVAYATTSPRPVPGEQGRYIFPALVPLAVLFAGGASAFRGRARAWIAGAVASLLPLFGLYAWLAALTGYYT